MKLSNEQARLKFIFKRDGLAAAVDFARRTMVSYRRAVLSRTGMCTSVHGRIRFIAAYKELKLFVNTNERTMTKEAISDDACLCS